MAFEIPWDVIRELRAGLRREAGVADYDPAIPPLPSIPDAVASLDPSLPSYLRCHRCRGGLLRGLRSTVCVYCGAEQGREGSTQSISFKSTAACSNFLEALGLDGSETIALDTEANKSSKGQDSPKDALVLSDVLDLEISWPPVRKEPDNITTTTVPSQSTYALNFSGVDLDSFFTGTNKEKASISSIASDEQLIPEKQITNVELHTISGSEDHGFFENVRSSDVAVSSLSNKGGEFDDPYADWEAHFQSASTEPIVSGSKAVDLFQNFATTEAANPTETLPQTDPLADNENVGSIKVGSEEPPNEKSQISSIDGWSQDDPWGHTNKELADTADQLKTVSETQDVDLKNDINNMASISDSWGQDDLWFTGGRMESNKTENINDDDGSYDDWQDFTSAAKTPEGLSNSQTQIGTRTTPHENSSKANPLELQDMDLGSFLHSNSSSVSQVGREGFGEAENMQLGASASDRMNGLHENIDANATILGAAGIENFSADSDLGPTNAKVEMLLSQMPDLSFMLKGELSIPKKSESSDSNS